MDQFVCVCYFVRIKNTLTYICRSNKTYACMTRCTQPMPILVRVVRCTSSRENFNSLLLNDELSVWQRRRRRRRRQKNTDTTRKHIAPPLDSPFLLLSSVIASDVTCQTIRKKGWLFWSLITTSMSTPRAMRYAHSYTRDFSDRRIRFLASTSQSISVKEVVVH